MSRARTLLVAALLVLGGGPLAAHETRPAYLEIVEEADGGARVVWREPLAGEYVLALAPWLSSGWLDRKPTRQWASAESATRVWDIAPPREPVGGQTLRIDGLERTITDVLVRIRHASGRETTTLLRPVSRELRIPAEGARGGLTVPAYFRLGLEHIFTGWDHLLYLFGLLLLIDGWRRLLAAISAFTVAHSLTLAAASLGLVRLDPAAVEAAIALSILYVAVELAHRARGEPGLAQQRPWLVAFGFGLLHGFGFAGALRDVGVPRETLVPALLSFNLGIEAGQLLFAAAALAVLYLASRLAPAWRASALWLAPHAIGAIAAFWFIERTLLLKE